MGVMSCHRKRCDSIMCDTYISTVGYVCYYCQKEFKLYVEQENLKLSTDKDIESALERFMETEFGTYHPNEKGKEMSINEYFSQHTRK